MEHTVRVKCKKGRAALNEAALRRHSRGERGAVKLAPLRRRSRGERAALNEAPLRRRSRGERGHVKLCPSAYAVAGRAPLCTRRVPWLSSSRRYSTRTYLRASLTNARSPCWTLLQLVSLVPYSRGRSELSSSFEPSGAPRRRRCCTSPGRRIYPVRRWPMAP